MLSQVREIAKNKDLTRSRKNTGEIVYSIGNFNTFEQAEFVRNDLIKLGLKQVFISEVNISIK